MNRILASRILRILIVALVPAVVLGVFVGALAAADNGTAKVPAALVNDDKLVTQTNADGTKTTIAAGRLVVSGLTKPSTAKSGVQIDWRLSNTAQAKELLQSGQVYAIVTIPKNFSKSIASLGGKTPTRGDISIRTDDAHGTLVSQLGGIVGGTISASVGKQLSASVVSGLYGGLASVHTSLAKAGSGASKLGDGAASLSAGLSKVADGQSALGTGASKLGGGASQLATGASSLAKGLDKAAAGAKGAATGATKYAKGVDSYTDGVTSYSKGVDSLLAGISPAFDPSAAAGQQQLADGTGQVATQLRALVAAGGLTQVQAGTLTALAGSLDTIEAGQAKAAAGSKQLAGAAAGIAKLQAAGAQLRTGGTSLDKGGASLATGLGKLPAGISAAATGARKLGTGASSIASGADGIATGASQLASGVRKSATGADGIASGAHKLGSGLSSGAAKVPALSKAQQKAAGKVVADPVSASATRAHEVTSAGEIVATLIIPVGLWIGAAALVLLFGAVRRRLLATGVGTGRLVGGALARGAVVAVAQAILVVVLLQVTLTVAWSAVPLLFVVTLLAAVAFLAIHQLLQAVLGRAGTVLSIVLLGVQLVAVGGIYPIQLVSTPFQVVSPFLPLTLATQAVQALVSGAGGSAVAGGIAGLVMWGLLAFVATTAVIARRRTSAALFASPAASFA